MSVTPSEQPPASDEELVRRFQASDDRESALLELYERHRTVTYAFFRRRIGSPETAAEQNQDLYLTVMKHLDGFRGESSFRTWLFRIAHYQLSHLRRRWRVHLDERADNLPDGLRDELVSMSSTADRDAARSQLSRTLRRCVAGLTEVERAVVYGQYYEEVTLEELTRLLKLTNKSGARAPLIAAQRKLRRCLERAGIQTPEVEDALGEGV